MKSRKLSLTILALIFLAGGYFFAMISNKHDAVVVSTSQLAGREVSSAISTQTAQDKASEARANASAHDARITAHVVPLSVPFIVQAPFGNWSDPIFQNACEEASIAMAMGWVDGIKSFTPNDARGRILNIVDFENRTFGYNTDTDVFDIQKMFQQDFHHNVTVKENITITDIKNELQEGNLVLVPAFGQALGNPNYTAPGPIVHMLVIIGYDQATKEFITNDPGTRHGSGYRYDENVLFSAIWEYSSGKDYPPVPKGILKKAMVVVSKQ
jgi:hypothetical protein